MPKPISLTIDVEEIAFGKIWRTLDAMNGVVSINIKGNGPKQKKSAKTNGRIGNNKKGIATIPHIVLTTLAVGEAMGRETLRKALEANGKMGTSLPDTITKLKNAKKIKVVGKGTYKITQAGLKAIAEQQEK